MDRKTFIKTCGLACIGLTAVSVFAPSCTPVKYITPVKENNKLKIARKEFELAEGKTGMRSYIIVKADDLDYPIVVYRFSETAYQALLLRCTHQFAELSVNGSLITCQAHGSEFDNKGEVLQGPAEQKLTSYKISINNDHLYIHLT